MTWSSRVQTETFLSTIEAEFIALSEGLRTISKLKEMSQQGISMISSMAGVHCRVFEEN